MATFYLWFVVDVAEVATHLQKIVLIIQGESYCLVIPEKILHGFIFLSKTDLATSLCYKDEQFANAA